jgi:hypothetical protein
MCAKSGFGFRGFIVSIYRKHTETLKFENVCQGFRRILMRSINNTLMLFF